MSQWIRYASTVSLGLSSLLTFPLVSYWPEFSHMATPTCQGNWGTVFFFFSGYLCFQLKFLSLIEKEGNGYWRKLAVCAPKRDKTEARAQKSLMQTKEFVFYCLGSVELFIYLVIYLFRATCVAYGNFQTRGQISCQPMPQPQQRGIQVASVSYTTTHENAGSLTHRASPRIESASSWMLVEFLTPEP